jgi:hypothetical protein
MALVAGVRWSFPGEDEGASISVDMGATEDAARRRAARPGGTDAISPNPPSGPTRRGRRGGLVWRPGKLGPPEVFAS